VTRTRVPNAMIANPAVSIISAPDTSGPMTISTSTLISGNLNVGSVNASAYSYFAGIMNQSSLQQGGSIGFSPDNALDIGQNATTARPRDIWLGRNLTAGGTVTTPNLTTTTSISTPKLLIGSQGAQIWSANGQAINVESPNSYAFLASKSGSHLTGNAYWDNVNWLRYDTSSPALAWIASPTSVVYYSAAAGANPISWAQAANWDRSGALNLSGTNPSIYKGGGVPQTPDLGLYCGTGANWMRIVNSGTLPIQFYNDGAAANNWIGGTLTMTVNSSGTVINAPTTINGTLTINGTTSGGQINSSYLNTEGIDVGAGPIYFAHNPSYYINKDSSNNLNVVNMHVVSWGNYYFNGNLGIFIGGWDGSWLHTSHSLMLNGNALGFSNNGGVYWQFDGSWMRMYGATGVGTSGNYYWMANNASVGLYWDGTWVNVQPRCWSPNEVNADVVVVRNGSSGLRFTDDNVREVRPTSTNQLKTYIYDAWEQWHRTWDGASMGYIDINGFHNGSTIKNKHNLRDFRDGLALLKDSRIKPRRYTMTDVPRGKGKRRGPPRERPEELVESEHVGFIAEEMVEVIPEVVGLDPETGEPAGINYGALVPILWDAVRRLAERLDKLEGATA